MTGVEPATLCLARGRTTSGSLRSPVEPGACRVKGESGLKSLCRDRDSTRTPVRAGDLRPPRLDLRRAPLRPRPLGELTVQNRLVLDSASLTASRRMAPFGRALTSGWISNTHATGRSEPVGAGLAMSAIDGRDGVTNARHAPRNRRASAPPPGARIAQDRAVRNA